MSPTVRLRIIRYCCNLCLFALLLSIASCGNKLKLEKTTFLRDYSSGSAMVNINGKLYLVGDNMSYLLVLDTAFNVVDSIKIVESTENPLPKKIKPDCEAAMVIRQNGTDMLLVISSGSADEHRNNAWLIDVNTKQKTTIDLGPFYNRLKASGVPGVNIEGAVLVKDAVILCNRGNNSTPVNNLIFTTPQLWTDPATAPINVTTIGNGKTKPFNGTSDIAYSAMFDCLIFAIATEDTKNAYDDGTIGKSYLWFVDNISRKKTSTIAPDRIIDLEAADKKFHGQKIEAVCILSETPTEMVLALSADNDVPSTTLFKVVIQK
jgi:hypothetical protein